MKSKLLASLIALCGLTSFAVDPVAVWNGDLSDGSTKGSFTMSKETSNSNVVFTETGSAVIAAVTGGTAPKGIMIGWDESNNIGSSLTVFVKYNGYARTSGMGNHSFISVLWQDVNNEVVAYANGSGKPGVAYGVNTSVSGTQGSVNNDATVPESGILMLSMSTQGASGGTLGTRFAVAAKNGDSYGQFSDLKYLDNVRWSSGKFRGIKIGGTIAQIGHYHRPGMTVEGVAMYAQGTTLDGANEMLATLFPAPESTTPVATPVLLLNFGTSHPNGWTSCGETNNGGNIPKDGTLSQEGGDATFKIEGSGNFFNESNASSGVTLVTGAGATIPTDILTEMKASLCLDDQVTLDETVYRTGLMNGGYNNHTATIAGLDKDSKYIVYAGFGMKKDTQCQGFTLNASGHCASIEKLEYIVTVAGSNTQVANDYTAFSQGVNVRPGVDGLMIVRMTNIVPTDEGKILFVPAGERAGINFLAVAKVNDVEESDETETTNYSFAKYLTTTYQDTGWNTTLTDIKAYGAITGTMAGGYMDNRPTPSTGVRFVDAKDGSNDVLEFQMQTKNGVHLKAVKVYLKETASGIQIRAVSAGHIDNAGTVGDNVTGWNDTLSTTLNGNGYSVASVSLSITKPVDKSVKGTIDEVTTEHSEDYTSNTITAKVTIENEGEYKGDAVLVYVLNGTTNEVAVAEGQTTLTINGLEQEKVYRGTLALGQKIGEDVTVIEGTEQTVALYQGEQKFVWIASPFVIQEKTLVNDAQGLTIENPFADPDYIDLCDSEYTVSISASEAVEAENDAALDGTEQGGIRIAQTSSGLKLQVVVDGAWTDFANAAVDTTYTLKVKFHYKKSQEGETDATSVTYTLDSTTKTSANTTGKQKVTEIFVSDGTNLSDDLLGACQLDKAVIVDIEIEPGDEVVGIEADNDEEAQKIAAKLKVGISEAVAAVMKTAAQQDAYRAYFKIIAVKAEDGTYTAQVAFADGVEEDIEKDIADAIDDVVESFNTGAAVKIDAKPGLYYGVKRGESPDKLDVEETTLATSEKVTITITKPDNASKHFYRIIVSSTPAETK